jgi:hypothetical protein
MRIKMNLEECEEERMTSKSLQYLCSESRWVFEYEDSLIVSREGREK